MREIKFRAWMNEWDDGGKMFYKIISLTPDFSEVQISLDGDNGYDGDFTVGKDVELMQYTGLKDKNGREIFEADILSGFKKELLKVEFHEGSFVVVLPSLYGDTFIRRDTLRHWLNNCEVVGNIYENAELLGEKS